MDVPFDRNKYRGVRYRNYRRPPWAPDGQSELSRATSAKLAPPSIWARSSPICVAASSLLRVADDDAEIRSGEDLGEDLGEDFGVDVGFDCSLMAT